MKLSGSSISLIKNGLKFKTFLRANFSVLFVNVLSIGLAEYQNHSVKVCADDNVSLLGVKVCMHYAAELIVAAK